MARRISLGQTARASSCRRLHNRKAQRLAQLLLTWFRANARDLPWRRTRDPYAVWISEIMLQQTQVKTVIPYWERWMRELPDVEILAAASPARVLKLWEGLGYYTRARNLHRAAQIIVAASESRSLLPASDLQGRARHSVRAVGRSRAPERRARSDAPYHAQLVPGRKVGTIGLSFSLPATNERGAGSSPFPRDFDAILALPGIGRYTAGAICSIAFNQPTPILDGNVIRVLTRLTGIGANAREPTVNARLWEIARQLVATAGALPDAGRTNCSHLNQALMELGATICTPHQPRCPLCPLRRHCIALRERRQGELPNLGERTRSTAREFHAFILERGGHLWLRQRPHGVVNAGLWEFPNAEARSWILAADHLGLRLGGVEPLCELRHSITRYRITLHAWRASLKSRQRIAPDRGHWLTPKQANALPLTAAHRKVLSQLH